MKRYWLFKWQQHDDGHPLDGFCGDYASLEEAFDEGERAIEDMVHVIDTRSGDIWENHVCDRHPLKWKSIGHISNRVMV